MSESLAGMAIKSTCDEQPVQRSNKYYIDIIERLYEHYSWITVFGLVQILAVILIVLVVLSDTDQPFNYHTLLMTIGMIILNANGILINRVMRWCGVERRNVWHTFIQLCTLLVSFTGLYVVYHNHNVTHMPHMQTLHSTLGLLAVIKFVLIYVIAFFAFLYPGIGVTGRQLVSPLHVFAGTAHIVLCSTVAITGFTEKSFLKFNNTTCNDMSNNSLPESDFLCTTIVAIIVSFTYCVVWLITKPEITPQTQLKNTVDTEESAMIITNT